MTWASKSVFHYHKVTILEFENTVVLVGLHYLLSAQGRYAVAISSRRVASA